MELSWRRCCKEGDVVKINQLPDLETLRRLFYVDEGNNLRNRVTRNSQALKGELAGYKLPRGYRVTRIYGKMYMNHRIIYALHYGELPPPDMEMDHRDRDPSNNDPSNLVLVSHRENTNNQGMQKNNTSGVKGVSYHKQRNKWRARIMINHKEKHLGIYTDFVDAVVARAKADLKYGTYTGSQEPQSITWLREHNLFHLIEEYYDQYRNSPQ